MARNEYEWGKGLGRAAGSMIQAPGRKRRAQQAAVEEYEKELDEERKRRREEKRMADLREHQDKAAELMQDLEHGDIMSEMYLGGATPSQIGSFRKSLREPKPRAPKGPTRYQQEYSSAMSMANKINQELGAAAKSVMDNPGSESKENYNALYEAKKKMLGEMNKREKKMTGGDWHSFSTAKDKIISGWDPEKIKLNEHVFKSVISNASSKAADVQTRIEDYKGKLSPYADLTGIPSTKDIYNAAHAAHSMGTTMDFITKSLEMTPDQLQHILQNGDFPAHEEEFLQAIHNNILASDFVNDPSAMERYKNREEMARARAKNREEKKRKKAHRKKMIEMYSIE
jgi:hypothetical protein